MALSTPESAAALSAAAATASVAATTAVALTSSVKAAVAAARASYEGLRRLSDNPLGVFLGC